MKGCGFFAKLSRMKYIRRWALMRNTRPENICEHSYDVAVLAHALATVTNTRFGGDVDVSRCVLLALYHDAPEIMTGDLPTPVKYYNDTIRDAYRQVETVSADGLIGLLPEDLQAVYGSLIRADEESEEYRIVKAADKLSALIKCVEELDAGNREFSKAKKATEAAVKKMHLPAADWFLAECLPAYSLTLDEQK